MYYRWEIFKIVNGDVAGWITHSKGATADEALIAAAKLEAVRSAQPRAVVADAADAGQSLIPAGETYLVLRADDDGGLASPSSQRIGARGPCARLLKLSAVTEPTFQTEAAV